jgi:dihydroorotate dehydrogenase (fumarate)
MTHYLNSSRASGSVDFTANIDFATDLCGYTLNSPIMNASGVMCTDEMDFKFLTISETGAVVSKSCTLTERTGNPEPRYYATGPDFSINSMGIPNHGYQFYGEMATKVKGWIASSERPRSVPYIMSVSTMDVGNALKMTQWIESEAPDVDIIEFNVSCPNLEGMPQLGYNFPEFHECLRKLSETFESASVAKGLKLPPYFDFAHWSTVADSILEFYPSFSFVTCCNSLGNGIYIDPSTDAMVIKPKGGFGGIGGKAMKATSLANVHRFHQLFGDKIDIIGSGGVTTGQDVYQYLLCGAKAVQVGTCLQEKHFPTFGRLTSELQEHIRLKGHVNLKDFRGKVKQYME